MQLTNQPPTDKFQNIQKTLEPQRLKRYWPVSQHQPEEAFRFYLWNCLISEAFYAPLHFSEIACRNAIHGALIFKKGNAWFDDPTLRKILDERFRSELDVAIADERAQHGANLTCHHIASALTFGFWEHITTKRFERLIWPRGITPVFKGAPFNAKRQELHDLIESVRRWRNRIAHHRAIFDKDPTRKHQDAIELIKWVCPDTAAWVASISRVPVAISLRPK